MQNLYKILLVDDEDEIRGRIASLIDQQSGFAVVGKAGNGHDAYELVEEIRPDVVLTDIKMPFVDGIELARMLKRDYPTVKVAFITGYDEFKYAQEAIELDVISYLMKPLTSKEINRFLKELKKTLDEEYRRKFSIDQALKYYEDTLPLMVDHHLSRLLVSSEHDLEHYQRLLDFGLEIKEGRFVCCSIELEMTDDQIELVALEKLRTLIKELMTTTFASYRFHHHMLVQNAYLVLIREEDEPILRALDAFLYELLQTAELYMDIRVRAGVSKVFNDFKGLQNAYQQAKKAIGYSRFLNTGRIAYIHEIEQKETESVFLDGDATGNLEHTVRFGTNDELSALFAEYQEKVMQDSTKWINLQHVVISLANVILGFREYVDEGWRDIVDERLLETMMSFSDVHALFEFAKDILFQLRARLIETNLSRTETILRDALGYVDQNYSDPTLSLNKVCEHLDISISYLSMLMKREKETTFNKYVVQVRMEKAKELLKRTNHKIIEIATMCGYNEVYYFSHSFKKYTGMSPKRYREESHV